MLLNYDDQIDISSFYKTRRDCKFLGFLPALDEGIFYYTVENIGTNKEFTNVTPIFGEYNDNVLTELEMWLEKDIHKKARENNKIFHELYRDEFLDKVQTHKYCVWFVGCDDGDKFMRFKSEEEAIEYLNEHDFFDEIYENPHCMNW